MKDETYLFISDVKEKKNIARGARYRRTHNGKGGAVKLPSDYLTRKERNAMNGECKTYRLNEPMTWKEFKQMPDDIKIKYVELIREKFGVCDNDFANMFGIGAKSVSLEFVKLGIGRGKRGRVADRGDIEAFRTWCRGESAAKKEEAEEVEEDVEEVVEEAIEEAEAPCEAQSEAVRLVPCTGGMTFEGNVSEALRAIEALLRGARVKMRVSWDVVE